MDMKIVKARSFLFEGMRSAIDDGRGHTVVTDLPPSKEGTDTGTMALELTLMSLAGCITTIFSLVAKNKKVKFEKLLCEIEAEPSEEKGFDNVVAILKVVSDSDRESLERVFGNTLVMCPVGVIIKNSGIKISEKLELVDQF